MGEDIKSFGERIIGNEFNAYTSLEKSKSIKEELKDINYFINKFKRIHSYFLSSEDEITAHESCFDINKKIKVENPDFPKFNSQLDFTEYLINKANNNKKIGFIIRLHQMTNKGKILNQLNILDIRTFLKNRYTAFYNLWRLRCFFFLLLRNHLS